MIPSHLKLQYSQEQIQKRVDELGREVSGWAKDVWERSHTDIVAVPVLRGAIFFFADLVRRIDHSVEIFPARTWAYRLGENEVQRDKVEVNIEGIPVQGRSILVVDDICDSGRTLQVLTQTFKDRGAREVKSAAMIRRVIEKETIIPDYVGFEYKGDEWFAGYGMEDSERWRNLPGAYIINARGTIS